MRSDRCTIQGDGTRCMRTVTSRMWPVRPMPPTVARNSSRSWSGPQTSTRPSATRMRSASTWCPKQPWRCCPLPCTSEATMPPRVTYLVPGVTGVNQRRGKEEPVHLLEREACLGVQHPGLLVETEDAVRQRGVERARAVGRRQRRVAVAAPQPTRQRHITTGRLEVLGADLDAGDAVATPTSDLSRWRRRHESESSTRRELAPRGRKIVRARARPQRQGEGMLLHFEPCREDVSRARAIWRPLGESVLLGLGGH
jgi:hypothetical protein